jgi:hypothetical protein
MPLADMNFSGVPVLLPANTCMICDKAIEEIGGRRMIAQRERGTTVLDYAVNGQFRNFQSCERLLANRELYFVAWGEESIFTRAVVQRARADYLTGFRPWFCQVCGNRLCHLCGALLPRPVGSNYIFDDGGDVHCAILGADLSCWTPECEKFTNLSKPYPGWSRTAPI